MTGSARKRARVAVTGSGSSRTMKVVSPRRMGRARSVHQSQAGALAFAAAQRALGEELADDAAPEAVRFVGAEAPGG